MLQVQPLMLLNTKFCKGCCSPLLLSATCLALTYPIDRRQSSLSDFEDDPGKSVLGHELTADKCLHAHKNVGELKQHAL